MGPLFYCAATTMEMGENKKVRPGNEPSRTERRWVPLSRGIIIGKMKDDMGRRFPAEGF